MVRVSGIMLLAWLCTGSVAAAQTITRANVDSGGAQAVNGLSTNPSVSADGRYVAFESQATNLVPGDTNQLSDIFVKDRQTGAITRVSVRSDGSEAGDGASVHPSISADGRYVAFESTATLVPDDTQRCAVSTPTRLTCSDIYVRDLVLNTTTRASLGSDNSQGNDESHNPHISADGRYVVFESNASNLVPEDTNGVSDVFLRDRQLNTTIRVSVSTGDAQGDAPSVSPSISDDASVITFLSHATTLDSSPDPDPLLCTPTGSNCDRVYLVTNPTTAPVVSRVPLTPNSPGFGQKAGRAATRAKVSRDGRSILAETTDTIVSGTTMPTLTTISSLVVYSGGVSHLVQSLVDRNSPIESFSSIDISGNGRVIAACRTPLTSDYGFVLFDTVTGLQSGIPGTTTLPDCGGVALNGDGNLALFTTSATTLVAGDTNSATDVFVMDRDPDHDGMPSEWETLFGLDPANPADAALDPDGDGKTNLQEFQAGTNPKGTVTRYLAEGASNSFFRTLIEIFNPNAAPATIVVRYLGESGGVITNTFTLPAKGYQQIYPGETFLPYNLPSPSFSTVVEADQVLAIERTMTWAQSATEGASYGAHAETAVSSPSNTWYFAEGATHGAFDTFYLLQNPNDTDASVTITYLLPAGHAPIVLTYPVVAHSRRTIWVDQEPFLDATDVSAKLESTLPIFAERAMYLSTPNQPFAGGTDGAGLPALATKWFVAEGATGGFFDLFYLIGNPSSATASVTVTYLLPDGTSFDKVYSVPAMTRLTIGVDGEDPRLAGTSVSGVVTSTVPIVVERAMWWPSPNWYEGSLTAATTETGTKWAFAGGYTSQAAAPGSEGATYILVANPSDTAANVTFDLLVAASVFTAGQTCNQTTVQVPAHGRYTAEVHDLCTNVTFTTPSTIAGTITSDGPGIVVERSTYWSNPGLGGAPPQFWAAGASTMATKIQ